MKYMREVMADQSVVPVGVDPVKEQINKFFNMTVFDPRIALTSQKDPPSKDILQAIGSDTLSWMKNWELIAQHFDVMEWWEKTGKIEYPLIYPVACCILALPDSNGRQERTFSHGTWVDDKLRKRLSDVGLRQRVLLKANAKFLQTHRAHVKEDQRKAAEQRTREYLKQSHLLNDVDDSSEELEAVEDMSSECEDMLEAYALADYIDGDSDEDL